MSRGYKCWACVGFDEAQVSLFSGFLGSLLALFLEGEEHAAKEGVKTPSNTQVECGRQKSALAGMLHQPIPTQA